MYGWRRVNRNLHLVEAVLNHYPLVALLYQTNRFRQMIIELYEATASDASEPLNSPISNTTGELPDQEPTLDLGDLMGSFDSREEAVDFVKKQFSTDNQSVTDSRFEPFNDYTHVELLTVTVQSKDQSTQNKNYYLVSDEGY